MNCEVDGSVQGQTSGNRVPPRSVGAGGARACAIAFLRLTLLSVVSGHRWPLCPRPKQLIFPVPQGRPVLHFLPRPQANQPVNPRIFWDQDGRASPPLGTLLVAVTERASSPSPLSPCLSFSGYYMWVLSLLLEEQFLKRGLRTSGVPSPFSNYSSVKLAQTTIPTD